METRMTNLRAILPDHHGIAVSCIKFERGDIVPCQCRPATPSGSSRYSFIVEYDRISAGALILRRLGYRLPVRMLRQRPPRRLRGYFPAHCASGSTERRIISTTCLIRVEDSIRLCGSRRFFFCST